MLCVFVTRLARLLQMAYINGRRVNFVATFDTSLEMASLPKQKLAVLFCHFFAASYELMRQSEIYFLRFAVNWARSGKKIFHPRSFSWMMKPSGKCVASHPTLDCVIRTEILVHVVLILEVWVTGLMSLESYLHLQ